MKKLFFLSGLPRSGSTLLAAILNQNPDFRATPTSSLIDMLGSMVYSWETNKAHHVQGRDDSILYSMLKSTIESRYPENKYIFDKSRGWPNPVIYNTMEKVLGYKPKIIATVRRVEDCAASFVRVVKPENLTDFLINSQPIQHLKESYLTLWDGYEAGLDIHFIDYDLFIDDPTYELEKLHEFLELPYFKYSITNIDASSVKEDDETVWNIPGLHDIGKSLERQHSLTAEKILGHHIHEFMQPMFWEGEKDLDTRDPLNVQLQLAKEGNFEESKKLLDAILDQEPDNHKAKYNRGWFYLNDGDWINGYACLEAGRKVNVFGDRALSDAPEPTLEWQFTPKTVLLHLEGGLGDQIWGLRWASDLYKLQYKVVVACAPDLAKVFNKNPHVSAVVMKETAVYTYHDYYIRSFSFPRLLEYKDAHDVEIRDRYIQSSSKPNPETLRIGLRWQGNPRFEHEQNRVFPPELLFNAIKDLRLKTTLPIEFVSLQRDISTEKKPDWVQDVNLDTWEDTIEEIGKCDLIISSCTSVAHMAAAMGKKVIVISPILPYFLWAQTPHLGESYWYENLILFKQCKYNDWYETFDKLEEYLNGIICEVERK